MCNSSHTRSAPMNRTPLTRRWQSVRRSLSWRPVARTATTRPTTRPTISWWHNSNTDPGKGYYEQVAKDFEADHPDVDIKIEAMQHEDMLTKLDAAFQSGDAPDVYMERGGGELADHVEAGLTKDLSESSADDHLRDRRLGRGLAGRRTRPTRCRSRSGWSASGTTRTSSRRPASPTTPTTWDEMYARRRTAEGRRASSRSRSAPGTSGRRRTTGTTSRSASARRTC